MKTDAPLRIGDMIPLTDPRVLGLHSIGVCEDGETAMALYNLIDGSTAAATWRWDQEPRASRVAYIVQEPDDGGLIE